MGNAYLVDGQRIGTDLYGKPILVGRVKGPLRMPEPCQPIGCDNGHHLAGCFYAAVDAEDAADD